MTVLFPFGEKVARKESCEKDVWNFLCTKREKQRTIWQKKKKEESSNIITMFTVENNMIYDIIIRHY